MSPRLDRAAESGNSVLWLQAEDLPEHRPGSTIRVDCSPMLETDSIVSDHQVSPCPILSLVLAHGSHLLRSSAFIASTSVCTGPHLLGLPVCKCSNIGAKRRSPRLHSGPQSSTPSRIGALWWGAPISSPDQILCAGAPPAPKALVRPGVKAPTAVPLLAGPKQSPPGPRPLRRRIQKAAVEGPASQPRPPPAPHHGPDHGSGRPLLSPREKRGSPLSLRRAANSPRGLSSLRGGLQASPCRARQRFFRPGRRSSDGRVLAHRHLGHAP
ncbi:hypothetical protein NDU88_002325 [Pleurodeles waltl]|uniref:Uncharacterized protein n=1 Tax=Pleurodeles waltl TaxID=8319 RepID=A0AAV7SBL5_PLEWA|nr:hypothetical protein NDU88_002325 [Pleurodeles waltl]